MQLVEDDYEWDEDDPTCIWCGKFVYENERNRTWHSNGEILCIRSGGNVRTPITRQATLLYIIPEIP